MAQKRLELVTVRILLTLVLLCLIPAAAAAEDGHAAWLRYAPLDRAARTASVRWFRAVSSCSATHPRSRRRETRSCAACAVCSDAM